MHKQIKISTSYKKNYTSIPNFFIDHYLAAANGDFVKVYIWLTKQVDTRASDISIGAIADVFNVTETDVLRAIKYWHNEGVIEATWADKSLVGINILDSEGKTVEATVDSDKAYNESISRPEPVVEDLSPQPVEPIIEERPDKPHYSTNELVSFKTEDNYSQLVFVAESLLGKSLNESDLRILISLNDWLGLPFEVIETLIEYCVSNNHRKMNYIEKVAIDWADKGITTQEQAIHRTKTHNKHVYTIFKALGIQNRNPVQFEIDLIDSWAERFNMDVILEACNRTIKQTNSGSMKYTDKILTEWGKQNVRQFSDIEALDQAFISKKKTQAKQTPKPAKSNKFNNYDQRDYDFDQLEKKAFEMRMKQTKGN